MHITKSKFPIFVKEGYELFSLDAIHRLSNACDYDDPPREWLHENKALVERVQRARYAQMKTPPLELISLDGLGDLTFGARDIAILYAHYLSDACGAAVTGALSDPMDMLRAPTVNQPRSHVEVEKPNEVDAAALSDTEGLLKDIERQLAVARDAATGVFSGEYPLHFHMELATRMTDSQVLDALQQVSPPDLFESATRKGIRRTLSTPFRFIDLKARVECSLELLAEVCESLQAGKDLQGLDLTSSPAARGREIAARHVDAYLRAHGELVIAYINSAEFQHQAVLQGEQLLSRIVRP